MRMKQFSLIFIGLLVTATTMAAIVAEHMKTVTLCKDIRIGMDGGIDASIESGGLTSRISVSLFSDHYKTRNKLQTYDGIEQWESDVGLHDIFISPEDPD